VGLIGEKTRGQRSRDTVPLKNELKNLPLHKMLFSAGAAQQL
jgi:hypothetical protein